MVAVVWQVHFSKRRAPKNDEDPRNKNLQKLGYDFHIYQKHDWPFWPFWPIRHSKPSTHQGKSHYLEFWVFEIIKSFLLYRSEAEKSIKLFKLLFKYIFTINDPKNAIIIPISFLWFSYDFLWFPMIVLWGRWNSKLIFVSTNVSAKQCQLELSRFANKSARRCCRKSINN